MAQMPVAPSLGLELGISPTSGASSGADWSSVGLGSHFSDFNVGNTGTDTPQTPITGLVRDLAVGVAVALLAKWLWKYVQ